MVDTMSKTDDKKKKGMVIVIAVGKKPPKSPTKTLDPDEKKKMDDAWGFLKMKETTKEGVPLGNTMARMRAGLEEHAQTRMKTGDLNDPNEEKETPPPRLGDEIAPSSAPVGGTVNPSTFQKPVVNTRSQVNQNPVGETDEHGRRILDFSDPPNPFDMKSVPMGAAWDWLIR